MRRSMGCPHDTVLPRGSGLEVGVVSSLLGVPKDTSRADYIKKKPLLQDEGEKVDGGLHSFYIGLNI